MCAQSALAWPCGPGRLVIGVCVSCGAALDRGGIASPLLCQRLVTGALGVYTGSDHIFVSQLSLALQLRADPQPERRQDRFPMCICKAGQGRGLNTVQHRKPGRPGPFPLAGPRRGRGRIRGYLRGPRGGTRFLHQTPGERCDILSQGRSQTGHRTVAYAPLTGLPTNPPPYSLGVVSRTNTVLPILCGAGPALRRGLHSRPWGVWGVSPH